MDLLVRNAEGNVPPKQREYAAKRLSRLQKYFNKATKVEMVHHEQRGKHRLEVTVFADEFTIRGEERDSSLKACIDKVTEKLEARLRSLKGRLIDAHRRKGANRIPEALAEAKPVKAQPFRVAERKRFAMKPMPPEEAALQMELLGHPFFVFRNEENGQFSVLYKRKGGGYGLLEPEA